MTLVAKPQARDHTLDSIFEELYQIPKFQRDYAWQKDNVETLIDDLRSLMDNRSEYYFLGQIVVTENQVENKEKRRYVVDGQQRLVTLQLLVLYLYRRIINSRYNEDSHMLLSLIQYKADIGQPPRPKLLLSDKANAIFQQLILTGEAPPVSSASTTTEKNLINSWAQIGESLSGEDDEYVVRFAAALKQHVIISRLEIGSISEAIEVFETMNQRGLRLTDSELMKNFLFRNISDKEYEQFSKKWSDVADQLFKLKPKRLASFNFLLRAELSSRTGDKVPSDGLLEAWNAYLVGTKEKPRVQTPHQFINELPEFAKAFANFAVQRKPDGNVSKHGAGLKHFNSVQHYPILLGGRKLENFDALHRIVEERVLLSLFAKEGPNNLEKIVPEWANSIYVLAKESPSASTEEIRAASSVAFKNVAELWDSYEVRFRALRYSDTKKTRFVLARIMQKLEDECSGEELSYSDYLIGGKRKHQIDHIEPQSTSRARQFDYEATNLVDSIGNLVLIKGLYNSSMGGIAPDLKTLYYSQTNLVMTQMLCPMKSLSIPVEKRRREVQSLKQRVGVEVTSWDKDAVLDLLYFYMNQFAQTFTSLNPPQFTRPERESENS